MAEPLVLPQPPNSTTGLASWANIIKGKIETNSLKNARLQNDTASAVSDLATFTSVNIAGTSAVSMTSGTAANVASLALTSGEWDVSGSAWLSVSSGGTLTAALAAVSATSATIPSEPGDGVAMSGWGGSLVAAAAENVVLATEEARVSISNTGTVYLVGEVTFSGTGTVGAYGSLRARYAGTYS